MLVFVLKSTACLLAFLLFYKLVLEREKMHRFNRFYLLTALVLSFGIPLVTFTTVVEVEPLPIFTEEFVPILDSIETVLEEPINYLPYILGAIYTLGVLFFLTLFVKNCIQMGSKVRQNKKVAQYNIVHVLLQQTVIPHTFLKYIFLNKADFEADKIPLEVLLHEEAHAVQKHSLDVLFIEFLQVFFWFNPLIYLVKHSIKLNHEFLADEAVLHHGVSTTDYGKILLDYSLPSHKNPPLLANSINYSSIKKRFTVMKKNTSKKSIWLRSLFFLPLVAALIYGFSNKETVEVVVQSNQKEATEQIVPQNAEEGATEKMMQEYRDYIQKYQDSKKKTVWMGEYKRIIGIYDLMTAKQKASVLDHTKVIQQLQTNLTTTKRKKPSQSEFNSWKNSEKFAIWIDSKNVSNSELDNYSVDDIVYFSGSFVHNNARTAKHPQEYQFNLFTNKGFENTYLKSGVNHFNSVLKKYNSERKVFLNADSKDNSELRLLYSRLWKMYKKFSSKEIEKYNPATSEPYPFYKTKAEQKVEEDLKNIRVYEDKEVGSKPSQDVVEIYKKKYWKYQKLVDKKPHYIHKSKKEKEAIEVLFSDLGGMYFRMSKANKSKVKRARVPQYPYVKLRKNGEIFYKKKEDLTEEDKKLLPPPPPPPLPPTQDISPEMIKAKEEFYEKAKIYGKAVQSYSKKGEGNIEELQKTYKEVMNHYNEFKKLTTGSYPPPPPPPPAPKVKKGEKSNIPPPPPPEPNTPKKATPKQLTEFNSLAKKYNAQSINDRVVKLKDLKRLEYVYEKMSLKQKENAQPFPECPPMPSSPVVKKGEKSNIPPPPNKPKTVDQEQEKTGFIDINNEKHYYVTNKKGKTQYYNRWGVLVDKDGKSLRKKQTKGHKVLKDQVISKVYKDDKVVSEFKVPERLKTEKSGYLYMNSETYFYSTDKKGNIKYYNKWGVRVKKDGTAM